MKIGIIGILNNPAKSNISHSAGMIKIVAKLYNATVLNDKDNYDEYDTLIIYHGPNFKSGSYNIIGGINDKILKRAEKLSKYNGNVLSLDNFQLNDFSIKRKLKLYDNFKSFIKIELKDAENLVIGDSHSLSVFPHHLNNYTINRNDGKTLFGFLKLNKNLSNYKHIIMYFGNIDIRFHLCRQNNPELATINLFNDYVNYAKKFNTTLTELLPIEHESRIIPKSGQYKGNNFYGDIELRKKLRLIANNIIINSGLPVLTWPNYFYDDLKNLKFEIMEPKQSVHIKPKYYINNGKI
jgi:hypothetical protein